MTGDGGRDLVAQAFTNWNQITSWAQRLAANGKVVSKGKGRFTAARTRMAAAQKAGWAKYRSAKAQTAEQSNLFAS
jgi:hypothetical protein